jgi:hypothetical protein
VENDTIEMVIGHARRRRALPGRSDQASGDVETEGRRADMTSLERAARMHTARRAPEGSQEPSFDAETKKGSLLKEPAVKRVRSRSANHEIRALPPRAVVSSTMHIVENAHICWLARFI